MWTTDGARVAVEVHWQVEPRFLAENEVQQAVAAALVHGDRAGIDVSVVLVDDRTLAGMHGNYLADPTPTDVMSFDLGEEGGGPAGELYVSVERAAEVAAERGVAPARELALYLVHGTLHLCGFDDHEPADRQRMREAEASVLGGLGYPPDPGAHE